MKRQLIEAELHDELGCFASIALAPDVFFANEDSKMGIPVA
jgi:hypothetical protein